MSVTIRAAVPGDLVTIGDIYAHHVRTGVATFELTAPDAAEWRRRFDAVTDAGLPFLVAVLDDADAEASFALHRSRGFVVVGRLRAVGFKHARWLDMVLMPLSLTELPDR